MTTKFIQIDNTIINVEQITHVEHIAADDTKEAETVIRFGGEFHSFRGEDALQFWKALRYSALNITPQRPELPVLGAK